jgi:FkbM family methyltransferase
MPDNHAPAIQWLKNLLVRAGPRSPLVRLSLKAHARGHGFRVSFPDQAIAIRRGTRELRIPLESFIEVPVTMECFDQFFDTIEPPLIDGLSVLDFSRPGVHVYRRSGVALHFPGIPEEDSMDAYTHWYSVQPGDTVWDAGAHAGATAYFLAQSVGPNGRVYAFEPDAGNYEYLIENIARHHLDNVIPVRKALSRATGTVAFQADGTMSAGIREHLLYADRGQTVDVESIALPDACKEFGVPAFVKMDIEGAEVAVIEGATEFLKDHAIHFAIESYHPVDGELTYHALERIFPSIGYEVSSADCFGQMFTWARKRS